MKNKIITLAILREARIDENRTPFSPSQISNLLKKFSNLKIIVQSSKKFPTKSTLIQTPDSLIDLC